MSALVKKLISIALGILASGIVFGIFVLKCGMDDYWEKGIIIACVVICVWIFFWPTIIWFYVTAIQNANLEYTPIVVESFSIRLALSLIAGPLVGIYAWIRDWSLIEFKPLFE